MLGLSENDCIYHTTTQNLTLRLTRYALILLELNKISEDKMLVRYYANKYTTLMIDLYHYKSEINLSLAHLCFQLSSTKVNFHLDFKKINGDRHAKLSNDFEQLVNNQKNK